MLLSQQISKESRSQSYQTNRRLNNNLVILIKTSKNTVWYNRVLAIVSLTIKKQKVAYNKKS